MGAELNVDHPADAALVDDRGGARDVVAGEARELRLVAGLWPCRDLRVRHPPGVDELVDGPDHLLRLVGGDPGEVDGDAVVVRARAADLGLADTQRVDALGDDGDGLLLHVGSRLPDREVRELVVDMCPAGQVEALVEVQLPAAEVGWQAGNVSGERIVVRDAVPVAGPVDEQREKEQPDDEQPNGPAED